MEVVNEAMPERSADGSSEDTAMSKRGKDDKGKKKGREKGKKELTETGACLCREKRKAIEGATVGRRHGN